jgi:sugar phosphate isomerase/epimerase
VKVSYISAEMSDDFERAVRLGAGAGLSAVSLRSKVFDKSIEDLTADEVQRARDALVDHDMRPGMILSPVGKCDIEDDAAISVQGDILRRTIAVAHGLETSTIRVFPFRPPDPVPYGESRLREYGERIVECWTPWLEMAAGAGIQLCFEWVGTTLALTCAQIRQVFDALGSPEHIGVIWEIDVSAQAGESPDVGYPHIRDLIRDVHIKRFGEGATRDEYATALRLLHTDGYEGPLTVEHWGGEAETLEGIAEVQELIDEL